MELRRAAADPLGAADVRRAARDRARTDRRHGGRGRRDRRRDGGDPLMSVEATHAAVPSVRRRDPMPASLLGVILFVASECVFFAALFGAYFTVRSNAGSDWPPAGISEGLHAWPLPAIATTFLVLSSVTMQFAIWAIRRGDRPT